MHLLRVLSHPRHWQWTHAEFTDRLDGIPHVVAELEHFQVIDVVAHVLLKVGFVHIHGIADKTVTAPKHHFGCFQLGSLGPTVFYL